MQQRDTTRDRQGVGRENAPDFDEEDTRRAHLVLPVSTKWMPYGALMRLPRDGHRLLHSG